MMRKKNVADMLSSRKLLSNLMNVYIEFFIFYAKEQMKYLHINAEKSA